MKLRYLRDECYRASSSTSLLGLLGQPIDIMGPSSRNHGLRIIAIGAFYRSFYYYGLNIVAAGRNTVNLFMITNHTIHYCIVIIAIFKLVFDDFTFEMAV